VGKDGKLADDLPFWLGGDADMLDMVAVVKRQVRK
jgi:hypothetical protein